MDDVATVSAWRTGDRAAGEALLAHHFDAVYGALRAGTDAPIAELIHRAFRTAVDRFYGDGDFAAHLLAVARGLAHGAGAAAPPASIDALDQAWTLAAVKRSLLGAEDVLRVGRFELLAGIGGAWSARDPEHGRDVTLVPVADVTAAERLTRVRDPGLLTVHELVVWGDARFAVVDRVDGATLRGWLAERRRPVDVVVATFQTLAGGLAAAHAAGLVHPGFTLDHVVVDAYGHPRVAGFTAPRTQAATEAPASPSVAPELARGAAATARSDQFAFCAALYEAIYGEPPFARGTTGRKLRHVRQPGGATGLMPHKVRRALDRGLSASPGARLQSMTALQTMLRHPKGKPIERKLAWAGGIIATLGIIGTIQKKTRTAPPAEPAAAERFDDDDECTEASQIDDLEARLPAIRASIDGSDHPTAPAAARESTVILRNYLERWSEMVRASCVATKVDDQQPDADYQRRRECLDHRRHLVELLTERLVRSGGELADTAVMAVSSLPSIEPCGDAAALRARPAPPTDAAQLATLANLRSDLDGVELDYLLGYYTDASASVTPLVARATELGYVPFTAEAELVAGRIRFALSTDRDTVTLLEAAHRDAIASADELGAAEAASLIARCEAYADGRRDEATRWLDIASAHAARVPGDRRLAGMVANARGHVRSGSGDDAAAFDAFDEAHRTWAALDGEHRLDVALALTNAGIALRRLERYPEARDKLDAAEVYSRGALGDQHLDVAFVATAQGNVAREARDYARAIERYELAVAIERANRADDDPELSNAIMRLSHVHLDLGRWTDARDTGAERLAILERAYGRDDDEIGGALVDLAAAEAGLGNYDAAAAHLTRALAVVPPKSGADELRAVILARRGDLAVRRADTRTALRELRRALALGEAAEGPDSADLAPALIGLGRVELARGRARDAARVTARAIELLRGFPDTDPVLAAARFEHARARWMLARGDARTAARADAVAAAKILADLGPAEQYEAEQAAAWLAAHP
jgi:tetratricopeptide (TPR) repeat protein